MAKRISTAASRIAGAALSAALAVTLVPAGAFAGEPAGGSAEVASSQAGQGQGSLVENSWRYRAGELIENAATSDDAVQLFATQPKIVDNPWTWQGDGYINPYGEIIPYAKLKGIDVSEHQYSIDWNQVASSDIDYAIIRCGYGSDYTSQDDKYWHENVAGCAQAGLPFGVYIYSYATNVDMARSEAQHVLRLLSEVDYSPTYPIYLDLEDSSILEAGLTAQDLGDIAEVFCTTLENAGYMAGVYANLNWWNTYLTDARFDRWERWVAQYNISCDYTGAHTMWQCTSSGTVPGISGSVDLNFDLVWRNRSYGAYYDVYPTDWVVTEGWFDYVVNEGLMQGDTDANGRETGYFHPKDTLTRGQFATILYRYANPDATDTEQNFAANGTPFGDNESGWYYTAAINWAYDNGIMSGYTNPETGKPTGYVGPNDPVTREDVATMIVRYVDSIGLDTDADTDLIDDVPDYDSIHGYAQNAVAWCFEHGIMTGSKDADGVAYLLPLESTTREQMAKLIAATAQTIDGLES